jgi:hypothetical protein
MADDVVRWKPPESLKSFIAAHGHKPIAFKHLDTIMDQIARIISNHHSEHIRPLEERIAKLQDEIEEAKATSLARCYRGTWSSSAFDAYERGAAVTYGGSLWIARSATRSKPGVDDTWQLAVKAGQDARS